MRVVIKGLNYTEMRYDNKRTWYETVKFWKLSKPRKPEDCGVWQNGKKIAEYKDMVDEGPTPFLRFPSKNKVRVQTLGTTPK